MDRAVRRGMDRRSTDEYTAPTPVHTSSYSPVHTPAYSPVHIPAYSPVHTPAYSPVHAPVYSQAAPIYSYAHNPLSISSYGSTGYGSAVYGGYAAPARVGHSYSAAPSYGGYGALWNAPKSPYGGYLTSGNYYPSYVYQNIGYGAPVHGYNSSPILKGY